jgi:hypothetical protein
MDFQSIIDEAISEGIAEFKNDVKLRVKTKLTNEFDSKYVDYIGVKNQLLESSDPLPEIECSKSAEELENIRHNHIEILANELISFDDLPGEPRKITKVEDFFKLQADTIQKSLVSLQQLAKVFLVEFKTNEVYKEAGCASVIRYYEEDIRRVKNPLIDYLAIRGINLSNSDGNDKSSDIRQKSFYILNLNANRILEILRRQQ